MHEIARTVRFCVNLAGDIESDAAQERVNTFANWPSMRGLGAYYELIVRCVGDPEATTGYLVNITVIDEAVRTQAIPLIAEAVRATPAVGPESLLGPIARRLADALAVQTDARLLSVRWMLTPYYGVEMQSSDPHHVELTQQFDFAAAHRLDVPSMTAGENRAVFGKCNNPNGHGHNYRLEVAIRADLDESEQATLSLGTLETIVHEIVVQRFDHKHLNLDTSEFASTNPSVEHIARTCHDLLVTPIAEAGGQLLRVTVWETEKTACTYPASVQS